MTMTTTQQHNKTVVDGMKSVPMPTIKVLLPSQLLLLLMPLLLPSVVSVQLLLLVPLLLVLVLKFLFAGAAHHLMAEVVMPPNWSLSPPENKNEMGIPLPTIVDNLQEEEPPPPKRELDSHR